VLRRLGHPFEPGRGLAAAEDAYLEGTGKGELP
jgi:hypothetical protein